MAIGNCDCCPRENVPGSVVNVPGEPFACFICQADPWEANPDADPYGEMEDAIEAVEARELARCSPTERGLRERGIYPTSRA